MFTERSDYLWTYFCNKVHISCWKVVAAGWSSAYKYSEKLSASICSTGIALEKLKTHKNPYLLHLLTLSVSMEAVDLRHLIIIFFYWGSKYPWAKLDKRRGEERERHTTLHSFGSESKYRFLPSIRVNHWPASRLLIYFTKYSNGLDIRDYPIHYCSPSKW